MEKLKLDLEIGNVLIRRSRECSKLRINRNNNIKEKSFSELMKKLFL